MINDRFIGSYNMTVDGKNRVTVPAEFRKKLESNSLILACEHVSSYPMIAVFDDSDVFFRVMEDYFGKQFSDIDFSRDASSISRTVNVDSANRIALGADSFLESTAEVTFVGIRDHFEIWKAEDLKSYSKRK